MSAKELREKRAALAKQIRQMADKISNESRDFTAEEKPGWEKCNSDYDSLTQQIDANERAEKIDADQRALSDSQIGRDDLSIQSGDRQERTAEQRAADEAVGIQAWVRNQSGMDLADEHVAAAQRSGINPNVRELTFRLHDTQTYGRMLQARRHQRAIGDAPMTVTTTAGGYLIPQGFVNQLETSMLSYANLETVCDVLRTPSGNDLPWPTATDNSNAGEMVGINSEVAEATPTIGQTTFKAFKGSSKIVIVPSELIQDSAFDMVSYLTGSLGERLGRLKAAQCTTGAGTTAPTGIVTAAASGKVCASATAITADEVLDLVHSIDPAYRQSAFNCGFMFHDNVLLALRKLKDGEGRYLWQPGTMAGEPDRLFNFPYTVNQGMASSITNNAKVMVFGAMRKFKIRLVAELRMKRLVERYAEKDQEGFVAFIRFDSNVLDAGTDPIKYMAMGA